MKDRMFMERTLLAGFGQADITPDLGTYLMGYVSADRPAERILDPLHATVVVLAQGNTRTAVVALDWSLICEAITEEIRAEIHKVTGIEPLNIQLSCSHTHSAPLTRTCWTIRQGDRKIEEGLAYVRKVIPAIVQAVKTASDSLTEAEVGFASIKSLTGVSRRGVGKDGVCGGFFADPDAVFDPTMTVAHFREHGTGKSLGILVHYGAHNTAMGNTRDVTRDWCGVMKDRIASQFHCTVMFLNGSEGDVGPRTNFIISPEGMLSAGVGDGLDSVREVGYRAATDAMTALRSIREFRSGLKLSIHTAPVEFPYAPLPEEKELRAEMACLEKENLQDGKEYLYCLKALEARQKPVVPSLIFQQTVVAFGPMVLLPLPVEIFSSISLRVRKNSPYPYTLLCSQSNGTHAYLTDREAVARGGYEVETRKMFGPYIFVDDIDDRIVSACLENMKTE
ncbi:MAG: Neutral/alkaline non-lysosomal ceramidase [Lentisphaerae bacterium ADurb.Bin242]|nr:MAG: Neutral/alkaline non-lysosomal ceramidase [Lentisphaerae bacterium ADurb.Bin242]